MKNLLFLFNLFLVVVFFLGLYIYSSGRLRSLLLYENMETLTDQDPTPPTTSTNASPTCPDLLVRKGNKYVLLNTQQPKKEGVNPIVFASLDEYAVYYRNQQASGSTCPVLYAQEETTAQGQDVYRLRPSPFDVQGGLSSTAAAAKPIPYLDASREHPPFNQGMYAGFDPQDQYVGRYTDLDKVHDSTKTLYSGVSPNAADPNWGGVEFTQELIDKGVYDENNVLIRVA